MSTTTIASGSPSGASGPSPSITPSHGRRKVSNASSTTCSGRSSSRSVCSTSPGRPCGPRGVVAVMKRIENMDYYDLLEVSPSATTQEIHKAYERLKKIYDPNSIALYSLFTPEETAALQLKLEEAYRTLILEDKRRQYDAVLKGQSDVSDPAAPASPQTPAPHPEQPSLPLTADADQLTAPGEAPPPPDPVPARTTGEIKPPPEFTGEFTGPAIKTLREQIGYDLRTVAGMTKVSIRYLEMIEEENFGKLPARTYIRGFLMLDAKTLGYDAEKLAADYLKRYDEAMKP